VTVTEERVIRIPGSPWACVRVKEQTWNLVALEAAVIQTVKSTELCAPTGDVMYKYVIYLYINVTNPNTRALRVLTFVSTKAETAVNSSVADGGTITVSVE